jgi:3-phenylpropionate/trans-cinnamate dioxygenase ferredoxin reductase component
MTRAARHVIVGGSAAAVSAALAMREHGFTGRITIVEAGADLPYERPPLSKSFTGLEMPRPVVAETVYEENAIELLLGATAASLDEKTRTVTLAGGERLEADAVLLTTGVSARKLRVPGEDLDHVLVLRDIHDARAVAARLDEGGPLVLVGGGFIGLEAAAVARRRGLDVTVVEVLPVCLGAALGHEIATAVERRHRLEGVQFYHERTVAAFRGSGAVEEVELDDGTRLPAATVLVGCGVVPNDELARRAGVRTADGVVVDDYGRTSHPWIWAAGDVASFFSPFTGRRQRIEHWDVARRHGGAVGASMAGVRTTNAEAPYFWSDQYGTRLQMYGRPGPGDRLVRREGVPPGGLLAFWVRGDRLAAAAGIDVPRELRATKPLIEHRIPVAIADLADPSVSLRSLARARAAAEKVPSR